MWTDNFCVFPTPIRELINKNESDVRFAIDASIYCTIGTVCPLSEEQSLLLFCIKQNKGINYPLVNPAGGGLAAAAAGCPATTAEGAICCFKAAI